MEIIDFCRIESLRRFFGSRCSLVALTMAQVLVQLLGNVAQKVVGSKPCCCGRSLLYVLLTIKTLFTNILDDIIIKL